jgi:hypothetical protein
MGRYVGGVVTIARTLHGGEDVTTDDHSGLEVSRRR